MIEWSDLFYKPKVYRPNKVGLPIYQEEKHDGHCVAIVQLRSVNIYTPHRTGNPLNISREVNAPDWAEDLPKDSAVICELVYPGKPATDVPRAIKSFPERLVYIPFAVPYYEGYDYRDCSYLAMHELLESATGRCAKYIKHMEPPEIESMRTEAKQKGLEGYVLKERGFSKWWKVKVIHTIDLEVIGLADGRGKYRGKVGAIRLRDKEGIEIQCSGMSDAVRFALSGKDLGRICEVKFNSKTSGGKLQFPRFIRWRDDKGEPDGIRD